MFYMEDTAMKVDVFTKKPRIIKLTSGMEIHLIYDKSVATYAELVIPFGSLHTQYEKDGKIYDVLPGSAHFLEHKIFAMPEIDAFEVFTKLGLNANAMTSYTQTSYTISGAEKMIEGVKYLMDMIDTPYFTDENVESEKQIITEELSMYDDDIDTKISNEVFKQMYWHHGLKDDIGGTIESVNSMTKELLYELYAAFYQPKGRILNISGPIDYDAYETYFKSYDVFTTVRASNIKLVPVNEPKEVIIEHNYLTMDVQMEKLGLGFKFNTDIFDYKDYFKKEIAAVFLFNILIGSTSDFHEEHIKTGLITAHFNFQIVAELDAFSILLTATTKSNTQLVEKLLDKLIEHKIDMLEVEQFENFKRTYLGHYIISLNDFEYKLYLYGKSYLEHLSIGEIISCISEITFEDVIKFQEDLKKAERSILLIEIK